MKAQKAAAEALALRRRLEHAQKLAAREHERDLQLAEIQRRVELSGLLSKLMLPCKL